MREKQENDAANAPVDRSDHQSFREWGNRISAWLYGTDHIKIAYSIQYEGVDIQPRSLKASSPPSRISQTWRRISGFSRPPLS
jgi:hypothetical protein